METAFATFNMFTPPTLLALLVTLAVIPIFRRLGPKLGLVDHPGGRKRHSSAIPLIGGPSIIFSLICVCWFFGIPDGYMGLSLGLIAMFVLSLMDDRFDLSAKWRFPTQAIIVTSALTIDNIWLTHLGAFNGEIISLGMFSYPITVIAILGITNAINMLDGLDGLASGIVLVILFFLLGFAANANSDVQFATSALLGAVFGFWLYNYRFPWRAKASVFLGDSGTTILGFALPYLALRLAINDATASFPIPMLLWLFSLPLWDIIAVVIKRVRKGNSPFLAGRDHIHHVLLSKGFSVRQTVLFIYGAATFPLALGSSLTLFGFNNLELYLAFLLAMTTYLFRIFHSEPSIPAEIIPLVDSEENRHRIQSYLKKAE